MTWTTPVTRATGYVVLASVWNNEHVNNLIDLRTRSIRGHVTDPYSSSITIDASAGDWHGISATNTTAFSILAPTNPPSGSETQDLTIEIVNNSGGTIGDITWSAFFRPLTGGPPAQPVNYNKPANGSRRAIHWRWNGVAWIWVGANSIDYT